MPLTSTQLGVIGENLLVNTVMKASDGRLSPFRPIADDHAKGFAIGAHRFEVPDATAFGAIRSKPALAVWGEADRTLAAEHFLPLFSEIFPIAPIHLLVGVGHYSFEDAPLEIAELIAAFLKAH